ncbi:Bug family tripartite tricarboxylate transporter substrate binding protein [Roseitranquillus sediminis]|uniref:Bug family tripartite tricarboxylate transporter substrate binding protein n=1 Tax=Roseitranquillus sediminis TaxID=2809051 RepID=UPI001D0CA670|nr:tripartite tricarboxylate transporter substrate binding protein [Roseitranquillus sediminis]MBM9593855.1 tripartite tricarboxylate transporter substrate binding protein [Roseitranquillus sediminis]
MKTMTIKAVTAATALFGAVAGAQAQDTNYPQQPVTWVIPFGAGGGTDQLARLLAAEADRIFGERVTVENHAGAGGVAGWEYVLDQPADGYTIFNASPTPIITLVSEENPPIEPTDISIVGYLSSYSALLIGGEEAFPDWESFKQAAEDRAITVGGTNSTLLGIANLMDQAGVEVVFVPYTSTGEAVTDYLGGHIDTVATTESTAVTIVPENGRVIVNSSSRPLLPEIEEQLGGDVVDAKDLGFDGISFPRWVGVHPDTPEEVKARVAELVGEVAQDPAVKEAFATAGSPIDYVGREEAAQDYEGLVERMRSAVGLLQ